MTQQDSSRLPSDYGTIREQWHSDDRAKRPLDPNKLRWLYDRARNTGTVLHGAPYDEQLWADLTEGLNSAIYELEAAWTVLDEIRAEPRVSLEELERRLDADG